MGACHRPPQNTSCHPEQGASPQASAAAKDPPKQERRPDFSVFPGISGDPSAPRASGRHSVAMQAKWRFVEHHAREKRERSQPFGARSKQPVRGTPYRRLAYGMQNTLEQWATLRSSLVAS